MSGNPTSFSVTPALPNGISLDTTTGAISGTPLSPRPTENYTITASNTVGVDVFTLVITVNPAAPVISYPSTTYSFTVGIAAKEIRPQVIGGAITNWEVDKPLPAGLTLSNSGFIEGTPTAASAPDNYRISAINVSGISTFDVRLAVASQPLLDLGHARRVVEMRFAGQRVLSNDDSGRAVLWNAQTSANLYSESETNVCPASSCNGRIALGGSVAALRNILGFEIRNAADGSHLGSVNHPAGGWWKLAADGSYLSAGNSSGLKVWSPQGTLLLDVAGNYGGAIVFAAPGEIRVASGPAGAFIENIAVPSGTVTLSPAIQGTAHSWFPDGERLLARTGSTVWVYSKLGVQEDIRSLSSTEDLAGSGNWFWNRQSGSVNLYRVGNSGTPAASFPIGISDELVPSGDTLAILKPGPRQMSVVDLSGSAPTLSNYSSPVSYLTGFAARSSGDWVVGNRDGVVLGEFSSPVPQLYALGKATGVAGSNAYFAIATASGTIRYYDSTTFALQGTLSLPKADLALSADGGVLMARTLKEGELPEYRMRFYSLPSGTSLFDRLYASAGNAPFSASMSASGTRVVEEHGAEFRVTDINGAPFSTVSGGTTSNEPSVLLAPAGNAFAIADPNPSSLANAFSNIYLNGSLSTAVQGSVLAWLSDDRMLVARYAVQGSLYDYHHSDIVSSTGQLILSPPDIPYMEVSQVVSPSTVYSTDNFIQDVTTGEMLWMSGSPDDGKGAVAGSHVIFASGGRVLAEPR